MSSTIINIPYESIQGMAFQLLTKSAFYNCMFYIVIILKHFNIVPFSKTSA